MHFIASFFLRKNRIMNESKENKGPLKERRHSNRKTGSREKRNYIRTNVPVPMLIYIQKKKEAEKITARAWNISASGMMIETDAKLAVGTEPDIDMNPPGSLNPIHCKGKIVWGSARNIGNGRNYGVEFISIEEDNKNTFLKFLCDLIYKNTERK